MTVSTPFVLMIVLGQNSSPNACLYSLSSFSSEPDTGEKSGLSDWLALRGKDTWLTHTGFYMASARCVAYIAHMLNDKKTMDKGKSKARQLQERISTLYMKNGKQNFDCPECGGSLTPGPEMSLFSRIVPAGHRCAVLMNYFKRSGSFWPGDEEKLFLKELKNETLIQEMSLSEELIKDGDEYSFSWCVRDVLFLNHIYDLI